MLIFHCRANTDCPTRDCHASTADLEEAERDAVVDASPYPGVLVPMRAGVEHIYVASRLGAGRLGVRPLLIDSARDMCDMRADKKAC